MKRSLVLIPCLLLAAGCAHRESMGAGERGSEDARGATGYGLRHGDATFNSPAEKLHTQMRKLWTDHVIWTRDYIIAAVDGSPSADQAAKRLMKNQEDIGTAIGKFYGAEAGEKLTALLKEHISIAVDLVAASKADDQPKFQHENKLWKQNAEEIATFLSQANPNWPKASLADMMNMHLTTTADELNARLKKQYDKDVKAFDAVFDHILRMADTLSSGIIKQFPEKFGST